MQQIIITEPGGTRKISLHYQTVAIPEPQANEVSCFKVHAFGLNRPDILQRQGVGILCLKA